MTSQTGDLDVRTIMALGLDPSSFGLVGASETTGRAPRGGGGTSQQQQTPGMPQHPVPQNGGKQAR